MEFSGLTELLRVEGLQRHIQGRPILRGVDLTVHSGEVVGLLGPNGAGKTTTFRLIAGIDRPRYGRILIKGRDLKGLPLHLRVKQGLGYLPQEVSVFRGLSTLENVALVLQISGDRQARKGAAKVLEQFHLEAVAQQRASTLSGGERRRLELARAVCLRPDVLVCDEPMTGVDPKAATELRSLLRDLASEGMGILLTDHNVAEALPACDRASLLVDGVVVEEGTATELATSETAQTAYFGDLWSAARSLARGESETL